jgi:hypothetical protein
LTIIGIPAMMTWPTFPGIEPPFIIPAAPAAAPQG